MIFVRATNCSLIEAAKLQASGTPVPEAVANNSEIPHLYNDIQSPQESQAETFAVSPQSLVMTSVPEQTVRPCSLGLKTESKASDTKIGFMETNDRETNDTKQHELPKVSSLKQCYGQDIVFLTEIKQREHDLEVEKARLEIDEMRFKGQQMIENIEMQRLKLQMDSLRQTGHI